MTEDERQSIINEITEKLLLALPDTVGNLIANHTALLELNKEFYLNHPEFRDKKDIVASVVEMIEGRDLTLDYKEILRQAPAEVNKRIAQTKNLTLNAPAKPSRHLKDLDLNTNGEL